jgi:opacity protein-like surface antigen
VIEQETVEQGDTAPRGRPTTRAIVVGAALAALLMAAGVFFALVQLVPSGSGSSEAGGQPTGVGQFGGGSGPGDASGTPSPPGPSASANPSATASPGDGVDLQATYQITTSVLGAKATVNVSITNVGTAASSDWVVVMKFSGVPLAVSPGEHVTYHGTNGDLTFTPAPEFRVVGPGDLVGFSFSVTGLLNAKLQSCTIDGRACTAA